MIFNTLFSFLFLSISLATRIPSKRFTPALGWNSWNAYHCSINEEIILQNAQAIVDLGLKELGYIYVNIDDCWQASRNSSNHIQPNTVTFPSGIGYISDKIHSMGLKFGLYSSAGTKTCAGLPGSLDYEMEDAESYKEWGVDYLKYDNCYNEGRVGRFNSFHRYQNMSQELVKSGRDIVFSLCSWGEDFVEDWAYTIGNSFRNGDDIYDSFYSMLQILNLSVPTLPKIKPGCWADLDMLEVGNGGMTYEEYKSHFSLWALLKSPLILGNKLNTVDKETLGIIGNKDIIDINQDPLGIPAQRRYLKNYRVQLYSGPIEGGWVMLLFNTADETVSVQVTWTDVFDREEMYPLKFTLKDLWNKNTKKVDLTVANDWFSVVPHGVLVYKIFVEEENKMDEEEL